MLQKIGIIGAGNMAEALIKGLRACGIKNVLISDVISARLALLRKKYSAKPVSSNMELARKCRIIILAVKPYDIDGVLRGIKACLTYRHLVISIAAGIRTGRIEKIIGKIPVVRVMPNTPALIRKGISGACCGRFATRKDQDAAIKILSSVGKVVNVDEKFMDVVTAVSGSGPAYFFFLEEALIDSAKKYGMSEATARKLVVDTAFGASSLALETGEHPRGLRQKVTSRGGTTEAAFKVFDQAGLKNIIEKAVDAAIKRARALSCS